MGKPGRELQRKNRSDFHLNVWEKCVLEGTFECRIVFEGTRKECEEEEKRLIKLYGKRTDDSGTLCNFTDGGSGGNTITTENRERRGKQISEKLLSHYSDPVVREKHRSKVQKRSKFSQEELNEKYGTPNKNTRLYFNPETREVKRFKSPPSKPWVPGTRGLHEKFSQQELNEKYGSSKVGKKWFFNTETRLTKMFQTDPGFPWIRGRKPPKEE